jgi:hypothetical protein
LGPTPYRPYWFCDPTMPLAVSSAMWYSGQSGRAVHS